MAVGRKPTTEEFNEIIADMVRLYQKNPNLMPDMDDRENIVGHENYTDEQEARTWLKDATIIIAELPDEKSGVIFWGKSANWFSILYVDIDGLHLKAQEDFDMIYWGTTRF